MKHQKDKMYTFEALYKRYKDHYLLSNTASDFYKLEEKILSSKKLHILINHSKGEKIVPSEGDFSALINSMPFFIFAGAQKCAMAEFIAMNNWVEDVNSIHNLCPAPNLFLKGEAILKRWRIKL